MGDSNDGLVGAEPSIQSVIGPDRLREFIMLPIWTVNDFRFTIKESHFKTRREIYQIPINIPLCLPYKSEKCYYKEVEGVGVYEQMLKKLEESVLFYGSSRLSRPKPVIQNLEHDRHVNIKFTSILTQTNLN
ncbi:hypothetical protein SO802_009623 [Lithocarpus litseifolius]|uniref:Uncharacterized protein n=1 Tax=Lithocarpus litseifolius TaxID=425828 RepID=A0AAW2DHI4_9ROSI